MLATQTNTIYTLLTMFTNWCLLSSFFSSVLERLLTTNPEYTFEKAPNMHAVQHIFYTLTLFTNPVVIMMYWGLVHTEHLKDIKDEF